MLVHNYSSDGSGDSILTKTLQGSSAGVGSLSMAGTSSSNAGGGLSSQGGGNSSMVPILTGVTSGSANNNNHSENDPFHPDVAIKYEDQDDDEYDEKTHMSSEDNDNSVQDDMMGGEPGSMGK